MKRHDIELRPTQFRRDGSAVHYDVERKQAEPPAIGWDDTPMIPPERVVRAVATVQGSYEDRARGFALATWQLSVVTGAGLVIAAAVLGASLSFLALAGWFFAGFTTVWLASFALHTFVSAEGAQLIEVIYLWRFLKAEQSERFRRQGKPDRTTARTVASVVLLALAIGATVLFGLAVIAAVVWENMPQ